jgi:phage-related minor tail protein
MLDKVVEWIKKIVEWFGNLSPGMQKAIVIVGVLVAALGPLLLILGQLSLGISALIGILPALGAAFTAATGPIGLIVAAIAAVIAIGVAVWKNWDKIKAVAKKIWDKIKAIFWAVVDWMKEWGILFLGPIGVVIKYWDGIAGWFSAAWERIKAVFWMVVDWMKEWGVLFLGPIGLVIKYWDEITGFFSGAWDKIKEIFWAAVEWIKGLWDGIVGFFKSIPEKIGKAFETIKDWLLAPFRAAISGIENAINWIIRMINKISFTVPDWVPGLGGKHFGFDISEVKLPKFGKGGVIPEETLLYGLESKRPYAIAGEEGPEVVSPAGALPPITNNISGPFYVRDENDIQRIGEELAKKLFRMVEQKYRARGISTA